MAKILNFPHLYPEGKGRIMAKFTVDKRLRGTTIRVLLFKDYSQLEDYLLENELTGFRKLRTRLLGRAYLGEFKLPSSIEFTEYYLIWCPVHLKYDASCFRGEDQVLVCRDCEKERIQRIWPDDENIENDD